MQADTLTSPLAPMPTTSLVGREHDLARLEALVRQPEIRLVTLTGPGGVGKTRLALQLAREMDPAQQVHIVFLADAPDTDAAMTALARAVGVSTTGVETPIGAIERAIGTASTLLVLDNVEHVADALTFLPRLLAACPGLTIVTTSRVTLRYSAEQVYPVEPLATATVDDEPAAATRLFLERARSVRPDLDTSPASLAAIEDICRQLDGLPLAIELAAARVRFLPPQALRDRLAERLSLLVGGPRDAPERHRTLRATLAWSHDLLQPNERILFRRLAIFQNGAPWNAVDAVCNATGDLGPGSEEILSALVDHNLVRIEETPATGPRVRMLLTIREFAMEQLVSSGEQDAVAGFHSRWFGTLVADAPPQTWRTGTSELRIWTLRHLPDTKNLSAAIEHLVETEQWSLAVRMVTGLLSFWNELGMGNEAMSWTQRMRPHAGAAPPATQAMFYRMVAGMLLIHDRFEEAIPIAERALAIAEGLGEHRILANTQNVLGLLYFRAGDREAGMRLQREAIATTNASGGDPLGGALFAIQLADMLVEIGEYAEAERTLAEGSPRIASARPEALPLVEGSWAALEQARGNLDAAGDHLERSLAYHVAPPHRLPATLVYRFLAAAQLAVERDQPQDAARLLGALRALAERTGEPVTPATLSDLMELDDHLSVSLEPGPRTMLDQEGRRMPLPEAIALAIAISRLRGEQPSAPATAGDALDLTPREREVLALLVEGTSNPGIAAALSISQRTVTTHLSHLYAKLDVVNRSEAIAKAVRMGLAHPAPRHT